MPVSVLRYGEGPAIWTTDVADRLKEVKVIEMAERGVLPANLENVEVLIGWRFPNNLLLNLPNLRWIQLISVGAEGLAKHPSIHSGVVITNAKGIFSDAVAEYVIWALLTVSRKYHIVMRNQMKRRWKHVSGSGLKGKVLGILGLGSAGKEIAVRAKGFGMKVIALVREIPVTREADSVDEIYSYKELAKVSPNLDALVLCVPLTDETKEIFSEQVISEIKPGGILIDVSRGGVRNNMAVVEALKKGKLRGAAFDVFEKEPISRWSSLWSLENLVVTPHLAALSSDYFERVSDLIFQNLVRYCAGQPLLNVVDRGKGY